MSSISVWSLSDVLDDAATISIQADEIHWRPLLDEPRPAASPRPSAPGEALEMPCLYCQGSVRRSTTPLRVERRGCRVALESIPAWVCQRCDKPYYEAADVDLLEGALERLRALVERGDGGRRAPRGRDGAPSPVSRSRRVA